MLGASARSNVEDYSESKCAPKVVVLIVSIPVLINIVEG
jgi:hypothetical protein